MDRIPGALESVSLQQVAECSGSEITKLEAGPTWAAGASIFAENISYNQDYTVRSCEVAGATLENCVLVHGHYPVCESGIVFDRMHHNSEHTRLKYIDNIGVFESKFSNAIERGRAKNVRKGSYYLISGSCHNLWHFMCNYASRLIMAQSMNLSPNMKYVVSKDIKPDFLEILEFLGVDKERIRYLEPGGVDIFERLFVSECPISVFKGGLLGHRSIGALWDNKATTQSAAPRRIFVSRRDAAWRRLLNEDDVERLLSKFGFVSLQLTHMNFQELISTFSSAEIVVSSSGANLAAAMFCPPGASVVELTYDPFTSKYYFQLSSSLRDCNHAKVRGVASPNDLGFERWDFTASLQDLENALTQALERG